MYQIIRAGMVIGLKLLSDGGVDVGVEGGEGGSGLENRHAVDVRLT
jgi:hypothetical protein